MKGKGLDLTAFWAQTPRVQTIQRSTEVERIGKHCVFRAKITHVLQYHDLTCVHYRTCGILDRTVAVISPAAVFCAISDWTVAVTDIIASSCEN
jgi:hypothetical protein